MPITNTSQEYGSVAKFFHWLIFILVSIMLAVGFLLDDFSKSMQPTAYSLHKLTGLTILALMVLRILWALMNKRPELPARSYKLTRFTARFVHFLLYLLLILMPLSGWIMSITAGRPPRLFGHVLTLPIQPNEQLSSFCKDLHELFAFTLLALIALHILAAFKHHYIDRDNVLKRMLPK